MGVFRVEIFTPRRVQVVRVVKRSAAQKETEPVGTPLNDTEKEQQEQQQAQKKSSSESPPQSRSATPPPPLPAQSAGSTAVGDNHSVGSVAISVHSSKDDLSTLGKDNNTRSGAGAGGGPLDESDSEQQQQQRTSSAGGGEREPQVVDPDEEVVIKKVNKTTANSEKDAAGGAGSKSAAAGGGGSGESSNPNPNATMGGTAATNTALAASSTTTGDDVEEYEVTYKVSKITRDDDQETAIANETMKNNNTFSSTSTAAAAALHNTFDDAELSVPIGSGALFPSSDSGVAGRTLSNASMVNRHPSMTTPTTTTTPFAADASKPFAAAPPATSEDDKQSGADGETQELDIEEELRLLLLECIPGVRTIWNRCNSLRNVGDNADERVVSFLQVIFYAKRRTAHIIVTRVMNEIGIGKDYGHVSIVECDYFRPIIHNIRRQKAADALVNEMNSQIEFDNVLRGVRQGAMLSFDFVAFLMIAAMIAGTGLAVNSTVSIIASMLVSPMMGPILATVLGTVLYLKKAHNVERIGRELLIQGFLVEMTCLLVCVIVGFVIGWCFMRHTDMFGWGDVGTVEMVSRTSTPNLLIGFVIAVPSGAGVALSLLGKNGNSLVGVAISASLLPPAVNCGLYFAFAIHKSDSSLARDGAVSLALTIINVLSIYISALTTFWIKKAAPLKDIEGRPLKNFFGVENFDDATNNMDEFDENCRALGLQHDPRIAAITPIRKQDPSSLQQQQQQLGFDLKTGSPLKKNGDANNNSSRHSPFGIHHRRVRTGVETLGDVSGLGSTYGHMGEAHWNGARGMLRAKSTVNFSNPHKRSLSDVDDLETSDSEDLEGGNEYPGLRPQRTRSA